MGACFYDQFGNPPQRFIWTILLAVITKLLSEFYDGSLKIHEFQKVEHFYQNKSENNNLACFSWLDYNLFPKTERISSETNIAKMIWNLFF